MQTQKVTRLNSAGWLAIAVVALLCLGLGITALRSCVPVNHLQPLPTEPVATSPTAELTTATVTARPTPDPDAAWETFMQVIYKCDSLPDKGDALAAYPDSFDSLTAGIEDLTTDEEWINWCYRNSCTNPEQICYLRRLVEFGPRNQECNAGSCENTVAVQSQACVNYLAVPPEVDGQSRLLARANFNDSAPFRLISGTAEFDEEHNKWIITNVEVTILPAPPEGP